MQKIKFHIKGMHCHSCALLIEDKLKEQIGILSAKVSQESNKAVVAFDEQKINKNQILGIVESAGDYQAEEIKENEENPDINKSNLNLLLTDKRSFVQGLLTGLGVISFGLLIILAALFNDSNNSSDNKSASAQDNQIKNSNQNINTAPTIPSQPSPEPAAIQVFNITKDDHVRGNFNAPITLVEFSDFECPFCERHFPTLNSILNKYGDKVRLVYKHFPLGFHPNAQKAAESSECADEQGKFWEYHDKIFENQPQGYSTDKFKQWAKDLGLKSGKFNDCLDSGKFAQKVQNDYQEGASKGVSGTPTTFINGQAIVGAVPYDSFAQAIDNLLK